MKKLFLQFIVTALTLVVTDYLIPGVEIRNSIDGLLLVTVMFTAINVIIKPLL
ncbi:phage holin family protein, partial [candidate division WWE3 bacterium]|nr:phage holin family protein [candidate division WWE3 bacterium]